MASKAQRQMPEQAPSSHQIQLIKPPNQTFQNSKFTAQLRVDQAQIKGLAISQKETYGLLNFFTINTAQLLNLSTIITQEGAMSWLVFSIKSSLLNFKTSGVILKSFLVNGTNMLHSQEPVAAEDFPAAEGIQQPLQPRGRTLFSYSLN